MEIVYLSARSHPALGKLRLSPLIARIGESRGRGLFNGSQADSSLLYGCCAYRSRLSLSSILSVLTTVYARFYVSGRETSGELGASRF